jgi:HK97 family phage portal protein
MNPFKRILSGISKEKTFTNILGSSMISGVDVPSLSQVDHLKSFQSSHVVFAATAKIAEKMGAIEFELYRLQGKNAIEQEQHELLDLLEKPNSMMSGSDLIEITSIFMSLVGQSFWYKARGVNGKVVELWYMRPDLVTIKPATDGTVFKYVFRNAQGQMQEFEPNDVIHFKNANPLSDHYGYGAGMALAMTILADVYARKWNTKFFYNSARPDAILTTEQKVDSDERQSIYDKWVEKFGSPDNAHKIAVLSHGLEYKQISMSQKDMDFSELRTAAREDILLALGVPKTILGLTEEVNRASAETALYVFVSETIVPKFNKLVKKLNHSLVLEFDLSLHLAFEDPTPANQESLDKHYEAVAGKIISINEARAEMGYTPIEGGDGVYMPLNMISIGTVKQTKSIQDEKLKSMYKKAVRGRKSLRETNDMVERAMKELTAKNAVIVKEVKEIEDVKKKEFDEEAQMLIWKGFDAKLTAYEKQFENIVGNLFVEQAKRYIAELLKKNTDELKNGNDFDLVDWKKEGIIFSKGVLGIVTDIVSDAGDAAFAQVGVKSIMTKAFDPADTLTAEWIKKKTMKFATEVNDTTLNKLKTTLSEGALKGESIQQLSKRVKEIFKQRLTSGTKTIARTEVLGATNAGTTFGYKQSGVVAQKQWLSAKDSRTRDAHAHANGEAVDLDKNFEVGGEELEYPGDPNGSPSNIINCRCGVIPIVKS